MYIHIFIKTEYFSEIDKSSLCFMLAPRLQFYTSGEFGSHAAPTIKLRI